MKLLTTLTVGLLVAASIGSASAQTVVRIAGSTAFRAGATAAIIDYLDTGGATVFAGYNGSSLLGSSSAILANGTVGSGGTATVIVETFWTGSLAGVVDVVAGNSTGSYINVSGLTPANITAINNAANAATANPYGGGVAITGFTTAPGIPHVAFSDSYQGTIAKELATGALTAPIGSFSTMSALSAACASTSIIDAGTAGNAKDAGFVGIVPFQWCIGNVQDATAKAAVSNISQQAARGLIGTGFIPQSYLTGGSSASDTANYFYMVGRNEDSGTRIAYLSEPQYGVTANPVQFSVTGSPVSSVAKFPITALNTEPNIIWNTTGHSGYASGGNVATALSNIENAGSLSFSGKSGENSGGSYFVSCLGVTDAKTTVGGGGKALSYNGVPFSIAAVQNGQYTLWTYEHVYRLASITGTTEGNIADAIADNVYNTDADVSATDGKHAEAVGSTNLAGGILDNLSSPVLVFRAVNEGGPLSNY